MRLETTALRHSVGLCDTVVRPARIMHLVQCIMHPGYEIHGRSPVPVERQSDVAVQLQGVVSRAPAVLHPTRATHSTAVE